MTVWDVAGWPFEYDLVMTSIHVLGYITGQIVSVYDMRIDW